jgi:plasmid stabilization system protein ParE
VPRLLVRARARAEIRDVFDWYLSRSPDAATRFIEAIDAAITEIADAPERFPVIHGKLRRRLLSRFPYAIYYKIFPTVVSVVGIIHGHRHPDAWLRRAEP